MDPNKIFNLFDSDSEGEGSIEEIKIKSKYHPNLLYIIEPGFI